MKKTFVKTLQIVAAANFMTDDINAVDIAAVATLNVKDLNFGIRVNIPKTAAMSENSEQLSDLVGSLIEEVRIAALEKIEELDPISNQPNLFSQPQAAV
jgi:hypothetical protein